MHDFPEITEALIHEWFGSSYASRGKRYFRQHKVLNSEVDEAENIILGVVQGRAVQPYNILIRLFANRRMESKCTCPMRNDCKHVAALLYEVMEQRTEDDMLEAEEASAAMPQAFGQWLGMLEKVKQGKPVAQEYPASIKQRLLYILEADGDHHIRMFFLSARLLKGGGYGKATPYEPSNILNYNTPQYILPADERILREVAMDRSLGSLRNFRIRGEEGLSILKRALASGRCHWQSKDSAALKRADKRTGEWKWQLTSGGDQHLTLMMEPDAFIVPTLPPWFVDPKRGECGAVQSGQAADMAEILLNVPAIELDCSDEILKAVEDKLPAGIPAPVRLHHEQRFVPPVPIVCLSTIKPKYRWGYRAPDHYHLLELKFDYEGNVAAYENGRDVGGLRSIQGDRVVDYVRDLKDESDSADLLATIGLYPMREDPMAASFEYSEHAFTLEDAGFWPEWVLYELPYLREQGFQVQVDDSFGFKVKKASAWNLDISGSSNSLMGQTSFMVRLDDGEQLDLIDVLAGWVGERPELLKETALAELREQESIALPLSDGCILAAPGKMVASILYYMLDMFAAGKSEQGLISAPQILGLEESLAELNEPIQITANAWLGRMKSLANVSKLPVVDVPATLKAELRDYQREGLNWMQFLRQMQLGGILADDMGLGKTVQSLAHILKEKEDGRLQQPALVIAPTSLMHNWRREAEKFTPGLSVLILHGPERAKHFDSLAEYDVVLTTYPLLARDFEVLADQAWHLLILDEAQYVKNPRAKVSKLVRRLTAAHKLCMTGTPMENHLGELWSQFDFLMPGYLYDLKGFTRLFRKPIEIEGDAVRQQALNVRIHPFMLRRSKDEVAIELPAKTEIIRSIEIEGAQRELYESVRLAMRKKVCDAVASMGVAQSQIIMLDALLKMRQVCCDPRLVNGLQGQPPESAKLHMLMDMLPEMVEEGRRILLFSQFTTMLKLIENKLNDGNIQYVKLTGQSKDRATPVDRFQNHEVPVFLISLRAGGVGLNLTAADTVIHYDPWWNPAVERQATDRAHRIGQDKAVFVYKLITEGTVEEKILEMQGRKQALAAAIHKKAGAQTPLWTPEDIDFLFTPLA